MLAVTAAHAKSTWAVMQTIYRKFYLTVAHIQTTVQSQSLQP